MRAHSIECGWSWDAKLRCYVC
jgi:hypothetical protein